MKNIISIIALSLMISSTFVSCSNEEDDIFEDMSAVRLEKAKAENTKFLASTDNGWAMEYYPNKFRDNDFKGKGYMLLTNFFTDGSVRIAMKNKLSGNQYVDSLSQWEVIADNGPVLTFNSFNPYLHLFSNPEDIPENISGNRDDEQGLGYEGDYEFITVDVKEGAEHVMLKGKKRGMYIRLTRIPKGITWPEYYAKIEALSGKLFKDAPNHVVLNNGKSNYEIYDISTTIANIVKEGGDVIADANYLPLINTVNGLRFRDPIERDGISAQEFIYDEAKDMLVSINNSDIVIKGAPKYEFMWSQMSNSSEKDRKGWTFNAKSKMSKKFADSYNEIVDAFKAVKYTVNSLTFTGMSKSANDPIGLVLKLAIRTDKGTSSNALYYYNFEGKDDSIKLTFDNADPVGNNLMKFGVEQLVKGVLGREYVLAADGTSLNLATVKMVAKDDPEMWVIVSLK